MKSYFLYVLYASCSFINDSFSFQFLNIYLILYFLNRLVDILICTTQKCPHGWFGDNCEIPAVECGNAHCFYGAACLESLNKNGETNYACDCKLAGHNGLSYAGQYCENVESNNCNADGDNNLQHANGHLFCTNGGTCKDPNNPHLGCDCPDDQ